MVTKTITWIRSYMRQGIDALPVNGPVPFTLGFCALITVLQVGRHFFAPIQSLYDVSAFSPAIWSPARFFLCAVFHEGWGHFAANLVGCVLAFGICEATLGTRRTLIGAAFGFWLSNPGVVLIASLFPHQPDTAWWLRFMTEIDYGASNGIYSVIGLLAASLRDPRIIILPFIVNGIAYSGMIESLLAFQHLIALFGGWLIGYRLLKRS